MNIIYILFIQIVYWYSITFRGNIKSLVEDTDRRPISSKYSSILNSVKWLFLISMLTLQHRFGFWYSFDQFWLVQLKKFVLKIKCDNFKADFPVSEVLKNLSRNIKFCWESSKNKCFLKIDITCFLRRVFSFHYYAKWAENSRFMEKIRLKISSW